MTTLNLSQFFKDKIKNKHISKNENYACRIVDFDFSKRKVFIVSRGNVSPIIIKLEKLIDDKAIVTNLSPLHASWAGYYYGIYCSRLPSKINFSSEIFCFANKSRFNIKMLTRKNEIVYFDNKEYSFHTENPIIIMSNESLINMFEQFQACYIGIISAIVKINSDKSRSFNCKLKIVE